MATDMKQILRQRILDEAPVWETEFSAGPGLVVSVSDAATVVAKAVADDALLASVMRNFITSGQYVDYDDGDRIPNTKPWVRFDGVIRVTDEELAAIERVSGY